MLNFWKINLPCKCRIFPIFIQNYCGLQFYWIWTAAKEVEHLVNLFLKDNYLFHVATFWRSQKHETLQTNRIEILDQFLFQNIYKVLTLHYTNNFSKFRHYSNVSQSPYTNRIHTKIKNTYSLRKLCYINKKNIYSSYFQFKVQFS